MTVKTATKLDVASAFAKFAALFKAIPSDKMEDIKDVLDQWNEPDGEHTNPSRAEIVTGPSQRMSGDGAVKMVGEYSSPAPQQGLTEQYAEFQRMLDGWGKSFADRLNPVLSRHEKAIGALTGIFAEMQKAATAAPAAPAEDTFLGKALTKLVKAKSALRKADLADEDEKEERKSHLAAASDLLKAAKRLLAKATEDMEDTDEEAAEKAMSELRGLAKALSKAEADDKEREEAAEKARTDAEAAAAKAKAEEKEREEAAEKARTDAEAAAKAAAGTGAATDTSKAAVTLDDIQASLKGLTTLPTTISDFMDVLAGKSRNPEQPAITKGTVETVDFAARVTQAIDDGSLSETGEMKARTLLQRVALAKAGRIPQGDVDAEIAKAPNEVRQLFQVAA